MELVVGRRLRADPVAERQGNLRKESVDRLRGVVGVEAVDKAERADFGGAALVAQDGTRVDQEVARVVRLRGDAEPAELVPGREVGHALRQRALHHGVGNGQVGLLPQVDLIEEPFAQLGRVRQRFHVARIRLTLEPRARLLRVLDRAAERVVPHAVALSRDGSFQRSQGHPRRTRGVRHHAHAAVRAAEPPERQEATVRVFGGKAHVARGPGPAQSRFQHQVFAGNRSHGSVGGRRHAQRLRASRHGARRTAVPDRAPVEVPVVLQALGRRGESGGLGGGVAEVLPTRVVRRHQVGAVVLVDRRKRRRGGPLRRGRPSVQRLDAIAPPVCPRAVDLAERPEVRGRLLQVVPGLIAHPAGFVLAIAPESFARRVHEHPAAELRASKGGRELLGALAAGQVGEEKRARVADERPAAGARDEGGLGEVAVANLQVLRLQHFGGEHGVDVLGCGPAPDAAGAGGAGRVVVLVGRRELQPLEVAPRDEVGHARHGVRAVHRRRALLQDLDPVQRNRRKGVHVHEPAAVHPHRHVGMPPAVEQHQRSRRPQAAKVHACDRFGHGAGLGRVGVAVPFAQRAVTGAQVLEEVGGLGRSLFRQASPARHRDRVRQRDRRLLEGGARYHDLDQFQRRGVQLHVDSRDLARANGHGTHDAREADQLHVEFVHARSDAGKHEPAAFPRQHADFQGGDVHLGRLERGACACAGNRADDRSGLGAELRRRDRRPQRDCERRDEQPLGAAVGRLGVAVGRPHLVIPRSAR